MRTYRFSVCFIDGFLLGLFMTLESHNCADETDAATNYE